MWLTKCCESQMMKKKHAHEIHHTVQEDNDVLQFYKINTMTLDYATEMDS